ncbi:MAG TPA: hypothetical protein VFO16_03695 [Pseudonocardiaceae bacterium]|nr:hypothetical protein [Pseudonocardiaceae bacterium]
MKDSRGDERPQWLDVAVTVLPPVSLITALLVYFAWARRAEYARALRFDVGLMEGSILDYLLRSVDAVFFPFLIAVVGLLLWLGVDRTVRRWAGNGTHGRAISRVSWALPVSGAALVVGAVLVGRASSVARPYVSVAWPFLAALAVLAAAYGASLRRLINRKAGSEDSAGHRWAINAVVGLLVSMLLFYGMDGFAKVVGRGLAKRIIEQPNQYTQPVLLYSGQDLQLDPAAATKQELPGGEHTAYHYRYEGLRLVFVDGSYFFLIGRTWKRPHGGTLMVLPRDGLRIEFPRGAV